MPADRMAHGRWGTTTEGEASGTAISAAAKAGVNERTNIVDSKHLGIGIVSPNVGGFDGAPPRDSRALNSLRLSSRREWTRISATTHARSRRPPCREKNGRREAKMLRMKGLYWRWRRKHKDDRMQGRR
jgi:hypothetical protein